MRNVLVIIFLTWLGFSATAQEITGTWYGILKVPGNEIRLVFHIENKDTGLVATLDSPDQKAFGIPVQSVSFENRELLLKLPALMAEYKGRLEDGVISGTFNQGGMSFDIQLTREMAERSVPRRPQEPVLPYPYIAEDIEFVNEADQVRLAGTLTLPEGAGPFPAVVLISGSGPQNRNSEVFGHKPFLVLSDYLTRNGIAVLRYDDRGIDKSGGDFGSATSVEFSRDAMAAVNYLKSRKEISPRYIGLAGHSEGGLIAPLAAINAPEIAFLVLLAGPGLPGDQIILLQQAMIGRANQVPEGMLQKAGELNRGAFSIVKTAHNYEVMNDSLARYFRNNMDGFLGEQKPANMNEEAYIANLIAQLANPWMRFFLTHDPVPVLEKIKCPVLVLAGEKDLQVPPDENLKAMEDAFNRGGNKQVTLLKMTGLNHLFQESRTGTPAEYAVIEQTFSPKAMDEMVRFIRQYTQK
jgi:uncharacterized protein